MRGSNPAWISPDRRGRLSSACALVVGLTAMVWAHTQGYAGLRLVRTIAMPGVSGRIDHMAIDLEHNRLFVAALGNNSLEVLDLGKARIIQSVKGLQKPQGTAYVAETGRLFVTSGGDGKCHVYSGEPLRRIAVLDVGADADNVRYDGAAGRLYVGYGSGSLAVIDASGLKRLADIKLAGHPESFQIEKAGPRIYVNVPDAGQVAVIDRLQQRVLTTWALGDLHANFPMALDEAHHQVLLATRKPARLVVLDSASGKKIEEVDCAGDADDLFYDEATGSVYVSCGEGSIESFARRTQRFGEAVRIPTASGARTSLWVPGRGELFVAAPGRGGRQAAVHIYRREQ